MLVTKESNNIYMKSNIKNICGTKNQLALKKYEEVYNQALVLTFISMKPSILIPISSDSSSLYALQWYGPSDQSNSITIP